jgi:YVTN family beta-propeller protein
MSLDARARRAAQAARGNVDRLPPPPAIGVLVARRRRRAAAVNVLAVVLIVTVGGVAWRFLPMGDPQPTATGLPRHVQAAIRVGKAPDAVAAEGSAVWVANSGDGTVSRIDSATNRVIATIDVGGPPTHLTAESGAVWVTTPHNLQWINPATNQVVQTIPLPAGLGEAVQTMSLPAGFSEAVLAFDGCLWVPLSDGTVRLLNPFDGRQLASVSVASQGFSALANGGDRLWAANSGTLVAIINSQDPQLTTRFALQQDGNRNPQVTDLVLVGRDMWLTNADGDVVRFLVETPDRVLRGQLVSREGPSAIAAGPTGVFVASRSTQTVTKFDLSTGQATARIRIPGVSDVAVGADAVWTTAKSRGLLYRIDPNATD